MPTSRYNTRSSRSQHNLLEVKQSSPRHLTPSLSSKPPSPPIQIVDDSNDSLADFNSEPIFIDDSAKDETTFSDNDIVDFEQLIKYENLTVKQRAGHKRVVVTSTIPKPPSHQTELLKFIMNNSQPSTSSKSPDSSEPLSNGAIPNGDSHELRSALNFRSDSKRNKTNPSPSDLPPHCIQTVNYSMMYSSLRNRCDSRTTNNNSFIYDSDLDYKLQFSSNSSIVSEKDALNSRLEKICNLSKDSHQYSRQLYGVQPSTNYRIPSMIQTRRNYFKDVTGESKLTPKKTLLSRQNHDKQNQHYRHDLINDLPVNNFLVSLSKPISIFGKKVYQRNNCKNYKNLNFKLNKCLASRSPDNSFEENKHFSDEKLNSSSIDVVKYLSLTVPGMNSFEFFEVLPRNQQTSVVEIVHHISNSSNKTSSSSGSSGDSSESLSNSVDSGSTPIRNETIKTSSTTPSPSTSLNLHTTMVRMDVSENSTTQRNVKLKNALIKTPVITKAPNMKAVTITNGSSATMTTTSSTSITAGQNIILNNFKIYPPLKNLKAISSGVIVSSPNSVASSSITNPTVSISGAGGSQQLLQILSTPPGRFGLNFSFIIFF